MTVRGLWLAWCAVMLAALLMLLGRPQATAPATGTNRPAVAAPLTLPATPDSPLTSDAEQQLLASTPMWGPRAARSTNPGQAQYAPAPEPAWALTGIFLAQGQRVALLTYEQQARPAMQLRAGDRLPDGRRIVSIESDGLRLTQGHGRRAVGQWLPVNRSVPPPG